MYRVKKKESSQMGMETSLISSAENFRHGSSRIDIIPVFPRKELHFSLSSKIMEYSTLTNIICVRRCTKKPFFFAALNSADLK